VHHFANLDAQDAWELSMIAPGLLGPDYFREIALRPATKRSG
jgi:hypothetical protein